MVRIFISKMCQTSRQINVLYTIYLEILMFDGDERQNRSTEECSKLKRSVDMTSSGKMVSTLEQIQVPNGTGPGVRRITRSVIFDKVKVRIKHTLRIRDYKDFWRHCSPIVTNHILLENKKVRWQHKYVTKNFDYTRIVDRLGKSITVRLVWQVCSAVVAITHLRIARPCYVMASRH